MSTNACYSQLCPVPAEYPPCPPGADLNETCNTRDFSGCCYQQPSRTQPIRPQAHLFTPNAPMETDTIYKRSYHGTCGDCFRARPIIPCNHLATNKAPMDTNTVQKLSYMPTCVVGRIRETKPKDNSLRFRGQLCTMTSQKHDYVPKGYSKRELIVPPTALYTPKDPMERCTVTKLSYCPVDVTKNPPPGIMLQDCHYCRPTAKPECLTVQKLSYAPVCPQPKDPMPWAEIARCPPPPYGNLCTTYNLSYMSNKACRTAPIMPINGLKFLGTDKSDGNTVYNLSYLPLDASCCRPAAILPHHGLFIPTGPMEKHTVQKLSYQPNSVARTLPIRPKEHSVKPSGPLYTMTTQKHDYVPKPGCRRALIIPPTLLCSPNAPIEKCTVTKLSYMPVDVTQNPRPELMTPPPGLISPKSPIEQCTVYKLSYRPVKPPRREPLPWANVSSYVKPTMPMEKCTVQKLSYGPPGSFSRGNPCGAGGDSGASEFPKAGIPA